MAARTDDQHRDIPHGCSDPSAGAVFLAKLMRFDTVRAFRAVRNDPAVGIEVGSLILPPIVGMVAGAVLFRRQRSNWAVRNFSHKINVGLYSFRRSTVVDGRPMMVVRTLSEKSLEALVENEHGRSELESAAKRNLCGKDFVGFVHMEEDSVKLWRSLLRKHVSTQFAAGTLKYDLGVSGVKCASYGLGLVSSIGYEGGTKLRAMLVSVATLQQAVDLTAAGMQPTYEQPGHHVAFPLVLRMAEVLDITPGSEAPQKRLKLPPAKADGLPIVTLLELCQ